jgi:hypothetical protein
MPMRQSPVLQMAVLQGRQIHMFISSGTGLIADQAAGYTFQIQRALNLLSAECYGRGKEGVFKRVIFPQPLIPYVERPSKHLTAEQRIAKYELEITTTAWQLAINSSSGNYMLKTFLSATDVVGIESGIEYDEPVRKALEKFQHQYPGWTDTALSPPLGVVMACNLQEFSH